ncbi:MAG: ectonucleotide pyrophosphatase/phosphodiesterase [Bacteroidia bacterium]
MSHILRIIPGAAIIAALLFFACRAPQRVALPAKDNAPGISDRPYVVLVSLDGFRYDYAEKYQASNLLRFAQEGVQAEALLPCFPSSTFPNHYSIVTGMYPATHGLVNNSYYDPARQAHYGMGDRAKVEDGSWYGGTPLWVLAEQAGMLSACYFWVGSEADVQGVRPSWYYKYDGSVPNADRVARVLEWLRLPEAKRPHFITLYFSDVDSKGHSLGPDAPGVGKAVQELDSLLGVLDAGIQALGLPVNLIIVSDHGMYGVDTEAPVYLAQEADLGPFEVARGSCVWMLYSQDSAQTEATYARLRERAAGRYDIYRRDEVPAHLHFRSSDRIGDLVAVARPPHVFAVWGQRPSPGAHGYDPDSTHEMGAIFFAKGPAFRAGVRTAPFRNIEVYPLVADLLQLVLPEGIDATPGALDSIRAY